MMRRLWPTTVSSSLKISRMMIKSFSGMRIGLCPLLIPSVWCARLMMVTCLDFMSAVVVLFIIRHLIIIEWLYLAVSMVTSELSRRSRLARVWMVDICILWTDSIMEMFILWAMTRFVSTLHLPPTVVSRTVSMVISQLNVSVRYSVLTRFFHDLISSSRRILILKDILRIILVIYQIGRSITTERSLWLLTVSSIRLLNRRKFLLTNFVIGMVW